MASRRLALNLNNALRNRAALKSVPSLRRGLATPISNGSLTESTTLSNGFTASKHVHIWLNRKLIENPDRYSAFAMGSDLDRRCVD
ncbi:MAG: hypothetical protein M1834_005902 [Cirrosporium novae-zelandiae]|nr:MAG: hypothetical protein M1834_005902 [Cirrosporium novae-zelandiae]